MNMNSCKCLIPLVYIIVGLVLSIAYYFGDFPAGLFLGPGFVLLALVILLLNFGFPQKLQSLIKG